MFQKYLQAQLVLFGQKTTCQKMKIKHQIEWIDKQIVVRQLITRSKMICKHVQVTQSQQQQNQDVSWHKNKVQQQPDFQNKKSAKTQQPNELEENQQMQILIRQKERQELFDDEFYGMSIENHVNALQFANSRSKSSEPDASQAVAMVQYDPIVLSEILKNNSQDSNDQQYDIPLKQIEQLQMEPV